MGTLKLLWSIRSSLLKVNVNRAAWRACSAEARHSAGGEGGAGELDITQACVVVGVRAKDNGFELTTAGKEVDGKCGGRISEALSKAHVLQAGQALLVPAPGGPYAAVAVAGIGKQNPDVNEELEHMDVGRENVRCGIGAAVSLLVKHGCQCIECDPCGDEEPAAEAAELAAWRFNHFKSDPQPPEVKVKEYGSKTGDLWIRGSVRGRAQNWARYLSDMPANKMTPQDLAQEALDVLCPLGCQVEARDLDWIKAQHMEAFLTVARGSCRPPVFLEVTYNGAGATDKPMLIAAKGVTFDSGGLCLKRPDNMVENRGSMAGAAVALGAIRAVAELKEKVSVRLVAPLCENMISGQCMKVGDVVRALNGFSIQIEDTDMEGRLMLADALVYGQALHKPGLVITCATLTHGVLMATGGGAFGCFSNSDNKWETMQTAGKWTGDRPWRFPLWQYYDHQIDNDSAVDLRNKGSGKATPCIGAAFLKNFVCTDWVHMDITGVGKLAHAPAPPYLDPRRMTGRPTRTLSWFLESLRK